VAGVTGDWFGVLGVRPRFGRHLTTADDRLGAAPVVMLSAGTAERLFGSAPNALGRTLRINETTYTVVGITPAGFAYPSGAEAWAPATPFFLADLVGAKSLHDADKVAWNLLVRVADGFTIEQTRVELASALGTLTTEAAWLGQQIIRAQSFADAVIGDVRPALLMLAGAVLLVLLVAAVNVANLLLVRGLTRTREFAVRAAIGASRGRILRQLATEAAMLVAIGAVLSLFVAYAALHVLVALAPAELPRLGQVGIDGRTLAFTSALACAAALVFGIMPALRSDGMWQSEPLRARDGSPEPGTRGYLLRHGLVVSQIAITALVLSTAGLLLRSFDRMQRLDLGFAAHDVMLAEVVIPPSRYLLEADHQAAMVRLAEAASALPGVSSATAIVTKPFAGNGGIDAIWYGEGQAIEQSSNPYTNYEGADAAYFSTMGLPILRGRGIEGSDIAGSPPVVVVNEAFARLFWPGEDPIGRRVKLGFADARSEWRTVVGLVADARYRELTNARPGVYVPFGQGIPLRPLFLAVRTSSDPISVTTAVRRIVAETEPSATVVGTTPLPHLLAEPLARPRFQSALIAAFALLGLGLSIIGTYGVLAFFVRQRRREIGIRMALGADPSNVCRLVLRKGIGIGVLGVLIGIAAAAAAGRLLQSLLFGVSATDPLVLSATAATLLAATVAATLLPTRLAARTDPLLVMRSD
jgi:putative ABC transport system permease protein